MVQARIHRGRIEPTEPLPADWEGRLVKITATTPDDLLPDLEARLAELHALGPMESEAGEQEAMAQAWEQLDRVSKRAMNSMAGDKS